MEWVKTILLTKYLYMHPSGICIATRHVTLQDTVWCYSSDLSLSVHSALRGLLSIVCSNYRRKGETLSNQETNNILHELPTCITSSLRNLTCKTEYVIINAERVWSGFRIYTFLTFLIWHIFILWNYLPVDTIISWTTYWTVVTGTATVLPLH